MLTYPRHVASCRHALLLRTDRRAFANRARRRLQMEDLENEMQSIYKQIGSEGRVPRPTWQSVPPKPMKVVHEDDKALLPGVCVACVCGVCVCVHSARRVLHGIVI